MTSRAILHALSLPMRSPFSNARMSMDRRQVALVEVIGETAGWGEAAPVPGQDESFEEVLKSARAGTPTPTLAAAIDQALADAVARDDGAPLEHHAGSVASCVAIGLDDPVADVDRAVEHGVGRVKLKVASGRFDHVAAIRKRHPNLVIGVDGNRSLTPGEWEAGEIRRLQIAFAEELYVDPDPELWSVFLGATGVSLFADESVTTVDDATWFLATCDGGGVTIKPGRVGWKGALDIREMCLAVGAPFRFSGLIETSIGRSYTNRLATDPRAAISDVAPASWFLEDVVPATTEQSSVAIPSGKGAGIVPDPTLLARYATESFEFEVSRQEDQGRD